MPTIIIEVDNDEEAKAILNVLETAEEEGELDFPFNTSVQEE